MKCYKAFALAGFGVLAACASKNSAPVVYGTQPSSTARIYTSANDIAVEQREALAQKQRLTRQAAWANDTQLHNAPTAAVIPVATTRNDTELKRQRYEYDAKPIYIANSDPVSLGGTIGREQQAGVVIVEPGDTVYGIARKTGSAPNAIIALNRLRKPYALNVGQQIRVPSSTVARSYQQTATPVRKVSNLSVRNDASYLVRPGDTLYSISRRTGTTVSSLAHANQMRAPYSLSVGQSLVVPEISLDNAIYRESTRTTSIEDTQRHTSKAISYDTPVQRPNARFVWPIKGAIVDRYGSTGSGKRNDGVNIAAPVGAPVRAAADGEVVYRGSELDGYGNLLLIKHEDGYVTAYAHNDVMLVRKGQKVRQGQVISKVGQSGSAKQPQLHFEIRQNLKAVDPTGLLGT